MTPSSLMTSILCSLKTLYILNPDLSCSRKLMSVCLTHPHGWLSSILIPTVPKTDFWSSLSDSLSTVFPNLIKEFTFSQVPKFNSLNYLLFLFFYRQILFILPLKYIWYPTSDDHSTISTLVQGIIRHPWVIPLESLLRFLPMLCFVARTSLQPLCWHPAVRVIF